METQPERWGARCSSSFSSLYSSSRLGCQRAFSYTHFLAKLLASLCLCCQICFMFVLWKLCCQRVRCCRLLSPVCHEFISPSVCLVCDLPPVVAFVLCRACLDFVRGTLARCFVGLSSNVSIFVPVFMLLVISHCMFYAFCLLLNSVKVQRASSFIFGLRDISWAWFYKSSPATLVGPPFWQCYCSSLHMLLEDGSNEILKPACLVQSTTSCVWHVPSSFVQFKLWKQLFDRLHLCNTQACGRTCTIVYDCTIVLWLFANICDLVQNKELAIVCPLFFVANQNNCELSCCNWTFLSQINFFNRIE